jgi:hypothetical protein
MEEKSDADANSALRRCFAQGLMFVERLEKFVSQSCRSGDEDEITVALKNSRLKNPGL